MTRDKWNGNTDESVHLRLHRRTLGKQCSIGDGIRAHREIDRPHNRQAWIDRHPHRRRRRHIDVVVRAELGQMLLHIGGKLTFQRPRCPVRRRDGQTDERIGKHLLRPREVRANKCLNRGRHALHLGHDGDAPDRIRPRDKVNLHRRPHRRRHRHARHCVADKQTVKDRPNDLRFLPRRDVRRAPSLHALRRNRSNRALHARAHNGRDRLISYDNSRSFLHAGGLCGINRRNDGACGKNAKQHERQTHSAQQGDALPHQNVPPTRKWTRPPCDPRP